MSDNDERRQWIRQVVSRYQTPLIRYVTQLTGSVETARDVVQDAFVQMVQSDPGKVNEQVGSWLYRVCRNRAFDLNKKERRMDYPGDQTIDSRDSGQPSPARAAESKRELGRALAALASLPQKQQEVVRLKLQSGLSYQQISDITGHSVSYVGVLLHTALKAVREQLAQGGAR